MAMVYAPAMEKYVNEAINTAVAKLGLVWASERQQSDAIAFVDAEDVLWIRQLGLKNTYSSSHSSSTP